MAVGQSANRPTAEQNKVESIIYDSSCICQKSNWNISNFRNDVQKEDVKAKAFIHVGK